VRCLDRQRTTRQCGRPLLHRVRSYSGRDLLGVESLTIILDRQRYAVGRVLQPHLHTVRMAVARDIRQRFLRDAE
jgi:hypothetical protein